MTVHCTRLADLEKALSARQKDLRAVSFDVFDTLVRRTLPHPDLTKTPAAKHLSHLLARRSVDASPTELLAQRLQLEREQRDLAARSGADPECHIDEVFRAWLMKNGFEPSHEMLNALLQVEIGCELQVAFPTAGMPEMIQRLKAQGLQLIYLTDMYLRKEMIDQILDVCGYANLFDAGYVSAETGSAKYSGRIFHQALAESGLKASELIHVGDRLEADILGAKKASVQAIQFTDPTEVSQHGAQVKVDLNRKMNSFWNGALWSDRSIAGPNCKAWMNREPGYQLGYEYLGPLFCNFIHRVMGTLAGSDTELVLFNAREGFLLHELYERLSRAFEPNTLPRALYSYLTRKAIYTASLHEFGDREIDMGFHTITPSIRNLFVRFSLPLKRLLPAVYRAGFENADEEVRDARRSPKLRKLIADPEFRFIVEQERSRCSELLSDYLSQLGFWSCENVAIVDVGWNGTTQDALAVAFCRREDAPILHGYYLALSGGMVTHDFPKSHYHGVYHDYRNTNSSSTFSRFVELFETACRAPHPTVVGFERNVSGQSVPVFKDHDSPEYRMEQADDPLVASLQVGILDYCDDYVRTIPFQDTTPETSSEYILYRLDRLLRFPSREEARILNSIAHSEGFGQSLVHLPKHVRAQESVENPLGECNIRQRVLWREGEFASSPLPGLNWFFNLYRMARTRRY